MKIISGSNLERNCQLEAAVAPTTAEAKARRARIVETTIGKTSDLSPQIKSFSSRAFAFHVVREVVKWGQTAGGAAQR
jgi:hypothetical protein